MELTATKYKQTELGLIHKDWSLKPLKEYLSENPKYGIGAAAVDFNSNYPTYLRITDIDEAGNLIKEGLKSVDHLDSSNYILEEGEIVFARTGASVGKSYLFNKKDGELVYAGFLIKIKPDPKKLSAEYLSKYVTTGKYWHWVIVNSMRSGQPGINSQEYGLLPIPLPPTLTEQKAIAQVLSDTDALIQALEKKITKKKDIKKGVMQKLLTPKEGWITAPLTESVDYIHGKAHEQDIVETGKYVVVNSKYISRNGTVVKYSNSNFCKAKSGDILTVLSDLPNGKALAKCFYVSEDDKYAVNQRICIWRPKKDKHPMFLKYLLNRNKYFLSLDDGVTQTHILNHHIEKCEISIPNNFDEQKQIGNILFDIDKEIAQLEQKLSKYQLAKQGMMQQLLTGKIRLV